jgi:trehalose 6-phosphate phosphatase
MRAPNRPRPLAALDLEALSPQGTALFLDFDGTLADFAEDPSAVVLPQEVLHSLTNLKQSTNGALAVISGRPIGDLDRMLAPLVVPLAGVHGLERRNAEARVLKAEVDQDAIEEIRAGLSVFADANPGTLVEVKPGAVALHYRKRPELADAALAVAEAVLAGHDGLRIMHGKMVIEIKDPSTTKANAIADFMAESPFEGRLPVFAGDDVTDEDAFHHIAVWDGITIKIGAGETAAGYRADDIDEFRAWLARLARSFREKAAGADG